MASEMPVVNAEFGDRPTIEFPTEIAPAGLKVVELFEGNGPMVRRGDTVTVNYHGVVWGKDTPFVLQLRTVHHAGHVRSIGVGRGRSRDVESDRSGTITSVPPVVSIRRSTVMAPVAFRSRHRRRGQG